MKKYSAIIISVISGILLFFVCFDHAKTSSPNEQYNVYLDGVLLGTIASKTELDSYINEKTKPLINVQNIVKTYCPINEEAQKLIDNGAEVKHYDNDKKEKCVDITLNSDKEVEMVYRPNGLKIEKVLTFTGNLSKIEDIYSKIVELKSFTVKGYQFIMRDEDKEFNIYVNDKKIFEQAVNDLIQTYVGKDTYKAYLDSSQLKIETTGTLLENIYIEEEITFKEKQIPIDEKIFTDYTSLAHFLLYGMTPKTSIYTVKADEMIEDIAFKNKVSIQEFLISNPKYKNINSLISSGTQVQIKETSPQLKVVVEQFVVMDQASEYKTVYQYDESKYIGYTETIQEGSSGLERISQREKIINGVIIYVEPKGKETLKSSVNRVVLKGDKAVPSVGDKGNWAWPTESGWTISTDYQWRYHPIFGYREFHPALDISGTGYNSAVYSANNGTVIKKTYGSGYGNYIVINHNNGYYTLYSHMSKFYNGIEVGSIVARGQQIGYIGSTGNSTGPHLHFEVWKGCENCDISPWTLYR